MFIHLRAVAITTFLIMLIGVAFIGLYARQFRDSSLKETSAAQLTSSLSSYVGTIWDRYAAEIIKPPGASPYLPSFQQETKRFFGEQQVKTTIFSPNISLPPNERIYYSSNNGQITSRSGIPVVPDYADIATATNGSPVNRLLKNVYITGDNMANSPRTLVHTIMPLRRTGNTSTDALVEIYMDVTPKWSSINQQLKLFLGALVGIFMLLMAALLMTARRAEAVITKQYDLNFELVAAAAQAEAQSRDKSQFLASVSHELRTPLNAIIGFSEILRNEAKEKLEKMYQDYLEDIYVSGKHLLSLINDILDFSKAEAGKLQIEWAETDATKVIRNSLRMVLPRAEAAQVTLVEDLPSYHLVVVTDPKKLKQVLLNLLSNAVKFTPAGGEVRCHAWIDVVTGALNLQVRDTGIGIAAKDISRVMTPFGQVDSALSRKYEGTGLGLPLSKKFVESMGGTFTIESEIKMGTTVTVNIPKAPPGWGTSAMIEKLSLKDTADVA